GDGRRWTSYSEIACRAAALYERTPVRTMRVRFSAALAVLIRAWCARASPGCVASRVGARYAPGRVGLRVNLELLLQRAVKCARNQGSPATGKSASNTGGP